MKRNPSTELVLFLWTIELYEWERRISLYSIQIEVIGSLILLLQVLNIETPLKPPVQSETRAVLLWGGWRIDPFCGLG